MSDISSPAYALPGICFPVFSVLQVDDYELFPGRTGEGLAHRFQPGVTVVAGINGLGKTTLLNIMLRLLVGPFNPEGLNPLDIGKRSHLLVRWNNRAYFSSRVMDTAARATAYAEVSIGQHVLKIRRKLDDLAITELVFDGQELEPGEDEYERVVLEATNAASRWDFDFLVRHLIFFLEQRTPLFWNERGQIEAFRVLLCDTYLANKFQEIQDEIQQKDSLFRNLRWNANKRAKDFEKERRRLSGAPADVARAEALVAETSGLREQVNRLDSAMRETAERQSDMRTQLLLRKIELEQELRHYEGLQHNYLTSIFPNLEESAQTVFHSLLSGNGCLVCGNRSPEKSERVRRLLAHHNCPVCESTLEEQERSLPTDTSSQSELLLVGERVSKLQRSISTLQQQEHQLGAQLGAYAKQRSNIEPDLVSLNNELIKINARVPVTPEALRALGEQVARESVELKAKEAELQKLYVQFEELIDQVKARVDAVEQTVRDKFSEYAQSFLEERCHLGLSSSNAKVGQERMFKYPNFDVYMTSAASPDREIRRHTETDVSESQKEFIDLAFRMALIASASPSTGRAMLVIETPEASLDTYFVDQAGKLLRSFGEQAPDGGNVVIVSSNLNRQNMIPALLGLVGPEETWPSPEYINARLINMLVEAQENAALRERRELYQKELDAATRQQLTSP